MLHKTKQLLVRARGVLWLPAVFAVCFALGYNRGGAPTVSARDRMADVISTADERVIVYVGSSTCRWSNHAGLEDAVRTIRARVQRSAEAESRRFVSVGVAKDADTRAGMEHLAKFGRFDEVMAGLGWANIGLLKYVYDQFKAPAATPQLIVVDRRMLGEPGERRLENARELVRRIGFEELKAWADGNEVIPSSTSIPAGAGASSSEK